MYSIQRAQLILELQRNWTNSQSIMYQSATARQKRMYLLGEKMGPEDSMEQRRSRDIAVKRFLQTINEHRTEHLGCRDLRDVYSSPIDLSLEQAIQWEQDFIQEVRDNQEAH